MIFQSSCKKEDTIPFQYIVPVNPDSFEIRLFDTSTAHCISYYKFDKNGRILSYSTGSWGHSEYSYSKHGYYNMPVLKESIPNQIGSNFSVTRYLLQDLTLTIFWNNDMVSNTYKYLLGENIKVRYKLSSQDDTINIYNYDSKKRLSSIYYPTEIDTFIYDQNDNLINVKRIKNNVITEDNVFTYDNNNRWTGHNNILDKYSKGREYAYTNSGYLSSVTYFQTYYNSSEKFLIYSYKLKNPINLKPINFYIYPYLGLPMI